MKFKFKKNQNCKQKSSSI